MARRYFIGDKVKTTHGVGRVRKVRTWRDYVVEMNDYEAVEFSAECKRLCGLNYRDNWVELLVDVGESMVEVQESTVELLEGREYDSRDQLEKGSVENCESSKRRDSRYTQKG